MLKLFIFAMKIILKKMFSGKRKSIWPLKQPSSDTLESTWTFYRVLSCSCIRGTNRALFPDIAVKVREPKSRSWKN